MIARVAGKLLDVSEVEIEVLIEFGDAEHPLQPLLDVALTRNVHDAIDGDGDVHPAEREED